MSRDEISRALILVIPHWLSLVFSIFVVIYVSVSLCVTWRTNRRQAQMAEQLVEACEAYARSDEALAPVQEALGQPTEAEAARERAAGYRVAARKLRESNRRRGRKGPVLAPESAAERLAAPAEGPGRPERSTGRSGPEEAG